MSDAFISYSRTDTEFIRQWFDTLSCPCRKGPRSGLPFKSLAGYLMSAFPFCFSWAIILL